MRLLCVRHGLSTANEKGVYQDDRDPLASLGKQQAHVVAKRLKQVPIDRIVASPLQRAKDTAEIINEAVCKKQVETCEYLRENRNPTEIIGKAYTDPEAMKLLLHLRSQFHDPKFILENGESFAQVRARAIAFLKLAEQYGEKETVLVVTHGMILKMIGVVILYGPDVSYTEFLRMNEKLVLSNTGITIFDYLQENWEIVSWNDIAHIFPAQIG